MVLNNFFFSENCVVSYVAGMKIAFFYHFWPNLDEHFVPQRSKYEIP